MRKREPPAFGKTEGLSGATWERVSDWHSVKVRFLLSDTWAAATLTVMLMVPPVEHAGLTSGS